MKEDSKRIIAKEILTNGKLLLLSLSISICAGVIYGYINYPPKTQYTQPWYSSALSKLVQCEEWPTSTDEIAPLVPMGMLNVGRHYSAYFSNETKYDDYVERFIFSTQYEYGAKVKIYEVIDNINKGRIKAWKKDLSSFSLWFLLIVSSGLILIRYLVIFVLSSAKWLKKYGGDE